MAAYVLGVDPSLTATGVARVTQDGQVATAHFGRKGKRDETLPQRSQRITAIADEVARWTGVQPLGPVDPECVVIESPAPSRQGGSNHDRSALWWRLADLFDLAHVVQVAPAQRAKWATGRGNADKGAVAAAMARLWPDVEIDCDNCADSLCLASIAAHRLGWLDVATKARDEVLGRIAWPEEVVA